MSGRVNLSAVALAVVIVAAAIGLDLARPSAAVSRPDPAPAGPAVAGAWYCAAGQTDEGGAVTYVAAAPRGSETDHAEVVADLFRAHALTKGSRAELFPGTAVTLDAPPDLTTTAASVRWFSQPAAASRIWRVDGAGLPPGIVEGPCAPGPSPTWYVPGMTTAGGARARLYLANPFETAASVAVTFTTPSGIVDPILLRNVVVESRSVTMLELNEYLPGTSDFGVIVNTRSGRVVLEGVQLANAAIDGIDGASLARATSRLAEIWTIPWTIADPVGAEPDETSGEDQAEPVGGVSSARSWIWIANPSDKPASVIVSLHLPTGASLPDLGDEVTVPAFGERRIDVGPLLPDGERAAGITVRTTNGVAIAASVATVVTDGDGRTGLSVQMGADAPDTVWVLSGFHGPSRRQFIDLVNPGGEEAVADVSVWNGVTVVRPAELQGLTIPAGATFESEIVASLFDTPNLTFFVSVRQGSVVAGRRAFDESGTLGWVLHGGASAAVWRGGETVPPVRYRDGLLREVGTVTGVADRRDDTGS